MSQRGSLYSLFSVTFTLPYICCLCSSHHTLHLNLKCFWRAVLIRSWSAPVWPQTLHVLFGCGCKCRQCTVDWGDVSTRCCFYKIVWMQCVQKAQNLVHFHHFNVYNMTLPLYISSSLLSVCAWVKAHRASKEMEGLSFYHLCAFI